MATAAITMNNAAPAAAVDLRRFVWTRKFMLSAADPRCPNCQGAGTRSALYWEGTPCGCVLRRIFATCYEQFRTIVQTEATFYPVTHTPSPGALGILYSRPCEEYCADFFLIAKRELNAREWAVFRLHFLLGAGSAICARSLKLDLDVVDHLIRFIERKLGRAYADTRPYSLYPVSEYFQPPSLVKPKRIPGGCS